MNQISAARILLVAVMLCACSIENKKVDYKSESKQVQPLEVPPDLAAPNASDRFTVPEANAATASDYNQGQQPAAKAVGNQTLLPQSGNARIERSGNQRWLVVDAPPEQVWPQVKEFWQEMGFIVASENAETGVMETDWAENRAKIPQDLFRNLLGKVIDQAYSTPERDKFRSRLERGLTPGTTEVFVTHRGMYEVFVNTSGMREAGKTVWQPRPADPELEAEMLQRLQAKLNGSRPTEATHAQAKPNAAPPEPRAVISKGAGGAPVLVMKDDFDRAWRRVGLSLDRLGFTVQDRDRTGGLYYVRYLNPDQETQKSGLLSKLAFWESDPKAKALEYRIAVLPDPKNGSEVKVLSADGAPDKSEAATRILNVLQEDLK